MGLCPNCSDNIERIRYSADSRSYGYVTSNGTRHLDFDQTESGCDEENHMFFCPSCDEEFTYAQAQEILSSDEPVPAEEEQVSTDLGRTWTTRIVRPAPIAPIPVPNVQGVRIT